MKKKGGGRFPLVRGSVQRYRGREKKMSRVVRGNRVARARRGRLYVSFLVEGKRGKRDSHFPPHRSTFDFASLSTLSSGAARMVGAWEICPARYSSRRERGRVLGGWVDRRRKHEKRTRNQVRGSLYCTFLL